LFAGSFTLLAAPGGDGTEPKKLRTKDEVLGELMAEILYGHQQRNFARTDNY